MYNTVVPFREYSLTGLSIKLHLCSMIIIIIRNFSSAGKKKVDHNQDTWLVEKGSLVE